MKEDELILVKTICIQYELEYSFIEELQNYGLIVIHEEENDKYLEAERLTDLEKMIRLHQELNINLEGIDVILNLMEKIDNLKYELTSTKNKLFLLED